MTKPISLLRQRMIDDMTFRNMSRNSQKVYSARGSMIMSTANSFHGLCSRRHAKFSQTAGSRKIYDVRPIYSSSIEPIKWI
jgi:hypothetical protein